jgi:hypothetical protein
MQPQNTSRATPAATGLVPQGIDRAGGAINQTHSLPALCVGRIRFVGQWTAAMSALAAAIELGAKGVPCFPCAQTKRPTCPNGFHNAETDADALAELSSKHPGPLIGARTGAASGVAVVDVDAKHACAIEWLKSSKPRLPRTRVHRTLSGGCHLLFRHNLVAPSRGLPRVLIPALTADT